MSGCPGTPLPAAPATEGLAGRGGAVFPSNFDCVTHRPMGRSDLARVGKGFRGSLAVPCEGSPASTPSYPRPHQQLPVSLGRTALAVLQLIAERPSFHLGIGTQGRESRQCPG